LVVPPAQVKLQAPPVQVGVPDWGAEQMFPQVPQLLVSDSTSTQDPSHSSFPAPQPVAQTLPEHTSSVAQASPQAPQLLGLLLRSTH
jgi:hypothetical protein